MAAPNAPMPLKNQVVETGSLVVTVPLQQLQATGFAQGAGGYNTGNPTATYTFAIGGVATGGSIKGKLWQELCDLLDRAAREGDAVVT